MHLNQLYQQATDENNSLEVRYEAARKLKEMSGKCAYPDCKQRSKASWSGVPLCRHHYVSIKEETQDYYTPEKKDRLKYNERYYYLKIAPLIPWSQVNKGVKSS